MDSITIERDSQAPIYEQVKRHIRRQVDGGLLAPGDRLPPTRELATSLGVARISVVTAYEELKAEGYLIAHVGRGTFVAEPATVEPEAPAALAGTGHRPAAALRDLLRLAARPGVIDFSTGAPAESFLPVAVIRAAIDEVLARDGAAAIAYEEAEGYAPLRAAVATMLHGRGIATSADEILITGGCQQALDLAVQALLGPGDVLLTTDPTYAGILDIARARGAAVVGVPLDADGMITDALETLILEHRPRLQYVAPTYHNPTGAVMALNRRRQLLELAARYRLPVLEDGVYEELNYVGTPPPPLKALAATQPDAAGLVLYASSFSKVLLPGMRIGYLLAGGRLYRRLARVKAAADICTPALNQRAVHLALAGGQIAEHVARVEQVSHQRRDAMLAAMAAHLPAARWQAPSGGLYLWAELPTDGPTAAELYLSAVQVGVAFAPGPLFSPSGGAQHHLRLNMVAHSPDVIAEGIARLGAAWEGLAAGYQPPAEEHRPLL